MKFSRLWFFFCVLAFPLNKFANTAYFNIKDTALVLVNLSISREVVLNIKALCELNFLSIV